MLIKAFCNDLFSSENKILDFFCDMIEQQSYLE